VQGAVQGSCELDGFCSFPDASCPSGSRYGRFSGDTSEQCVVRTTPCVAHLEAGAAHTCAVKNDGALLCWGRSADGQLGTGNTTRNLTPIGVGPAGMPIMRASRVAAGGGHTCVRRSDGSLACWGKNDAGQIGFDTAALPALAPREVALSTVAAISTGRDHSCVLLGNEAAWCFGRDADGQLGDGGGGDNLGPRNVLASAGVQFEAAEISAGTSHTCARAASGAAFCWGRNDRGQLGLGNMGAAVGMPAPLASLGTTVSTIAAGNDFSCATVKGDTVSCWGKNDEAQLGAAGPDSAVPQQLPLGGDAVELALGDRHACARLRDGTVRCWGAGAAPRTITRSDGRNLTRVTGITAGGAHTCVTTRDATVLCWGDNGDGQVGDGSTDPRATPTPVLLSCP
jgi:alpha-tubulin suppressor-like RCC1 family protein